MTAQARIMRHLGAGSQALSYLLGGLAVVLAAGALLTASGPAAIGAWVIDVLGVTFMGLLALLVLTCLYCLVHLNGATGPERAPWLEAGVQAANGVTTLALTYTLLGISLGIGSLAGQDLTPETVQAIIRDLTANFSLAFMTTVIGLPLSALLRALILVSDARHQAARPPALPAPLERNVP